MIDLRYFLSAIITIIRFEQIGQFLTDKDCLNFSEEREVILVVSTYLTGVFIKVSVFVLEGNIY